MKSIIRKILLTLILLIFTFNILGVNITMAVEDESEEETNINEIVEKVEELKQQLYEGIDVSEDRDGSIIMKVEKDGTLLFDGKGRMANNFGFLYEKSGNTVFGEMNLFEMGGGDILQLLMEIFNTIDPVERINIKKVEFTEGIENIECTIDISATRKISDISEILEGCATLLLDFKDVKNIKIPSTVTSIGMGAFSQYTNIESITIPKNVTDIEEGALQAVKEINVESENEKYCSIDGVLFSKDKTELIKYPGRKTDDSYAIPNSVTSIHKGAFLLNSNLKRITIPNSVKKIGDLAFGACTELENIVIPESVDEIGSVAFGYCVSVKDIKILSNKLNMGIGAFAGVGESFSLENIFTPKDFEYSNEDMTTNPFEPFNNMLITIPVDINNNSVEIPELVKRIMNNEDSLYSEKIEYYGCKLSEDGSKIELKKEKNEEELDEEDEKIADFISGKYCVISPNEGFFKNTDILLVENGSITYNTYDYLPKMMGISNMNVGPKIRVSGKYFADVTEFNNGHRWINSDIESRIHLKEGDKITSNGGNTHIFKENGEFTYNYKTKDGIEKTATAKVENIDRDAPKVMKVNKEINEEGEIILTIDAQDDKSGVANYIFTGNNEGEKVEKELQKVGIRIPRAWYEYIFGSNYVHIDDVNDPKEDKNKYKIEENEKRINVFVTDMARNLAIRTIDVETCAIIGDVKEDGDIDFKDILEINKYRLNKLDKTKLSDAKLVSADVNEDGQIDFKDMLQINKFRLGKLTSF